MTERFYLTTFFLITIFFISPAFADVIEPGEKVITFDYQLTNIQDYPDYVFVLHGTPGPTMQVLNSSEFSFYKLSTCYIYAIPKSVFNQVNWDKMNDTELEEFLRNDSRVARSNLSLEGLYGSVNMGNPLESALVLLRIDSIQGNNLKIQKTKVIYGYSGGQKNEKTFQNQNQTPESSLPESSYLNYLYYLILPLVAVVGLIYILKKRKSS
jgi:hypothetical protein